MRKIWSAAAALALMGSGTAFAQAAPDGGALFKQRCQMCHTVTPGQIHGLGPSLAGVAGRKAASTDFPYSPALRKSGLVWNPATLDKFLAAPGALVPGTRMTISVSDPRQRAAIVAFLGNRKK